MEKIFHVHCIALYCHLSYCRSEKLSSNFSKHSTLHQIDIFRAQLIKEVDNYLDLIRRNRNKVGQVTPFTFTKFLISPRNPFLKNLSYPRYLSNVRSTLWSVHWMKDVSHYTDQPVLMYNIVVFHQHNVLLFK